MLNNSNLVTFQYNGGIDSNVFQCEFVEFSIEFNGKVYEDIDFVLEENYDSCRELIELRPHILGNANTDFMADFLKATDKQIVIDANVYDVVNDGNKVKFTLWDGKNFGTKPTLKFKKKSLGITNLDMFIISNNIVIT